MRITATIVGISTSLFALRARADGPAIRRLDLGLTVSGLHAARVSGGTKTYEAKDQGFTLGVQPYAAWRLSDVVGVGLGVPTTINAPGATSNAYDIGLTPLVRVGYPTGSAFYPFILMEGGPAWSRQPSQAWLSGAHVSARLGARISIADAMSVVAELAYDYTSFSGDLPLYYATIGPQAPIEHGSVKTSYLGAGLGFALAF